MDFQAWVETSELDRTSRRESSRLLSRGIKRRYLEDLATSIAFVGSFLPLGVPLPSSYSERQRYPCGWIEHYDLTTDMVLLQSGHESWWGPFEQLVLIQRDFPAPERPEVFRASKYMESLRRRELALEGPTVEEHYALKLESLGFPELTEEAAQDCYLGKMALAILGEDLEGTPEGYEDRLRALREEMRGT